MACKNCGKNRQVTTLLCTNCGRLIKFSYRSTPTLEAQIKRKMPNCHHCGNTELEASNIPDHRKS